MKVIKRGYTICSKENIMRDIKKNEIHEDRLSKAYLEAGADWVLYSFEELKKMIDNIEFYTISKN
jgi:hypothetical protein